jgi:hypothetical protein
MSPDEIIKGYLGDFTLREIYLDSEKSALLQPDIAEWLHNYLNPTYKLASEKYFNRNFLMCTYKDTYQYRCIGVSRSGDVFLSSDFGDNSGHTLRTSLDNCSNFIICKRNIASKGSSLWSFIRQSIRRLMS